MFDFRYHVVSLAAVFLALIVGIVIGVGLTGQGVVQDTERKALNDSIARLKAQLDSANTRLEQERAAALFVDAAYPAVMTNRLAGRHIVVVFVGRPDASLRSAISQTIADADGTIVRLRVLNVPVDGDVLTGTVDSKTDLTSLVSSVDVRSIGKALAGELVAGGDAPLWDALASRLVIERAVPDATMPADGVVVVRTADPQQGPTAQFLNGLYSGLKGHGPAVWVDNGKPDAEQRRHPSGYAVVRGADTALGRVVLAVLLQTGVPGDYGPGADTVVPPIEPVEAPSAQGG